MKELIGRVAELTVLCAALDALLPEGKTRERARFCLSLIITLSALDALSGILQ